MIFVRSRAEMPDLANYSLNEADDHLFKKLTKAARTYSLSKLDYGIDPNARRADFLDWVKTLQDVTFSTGDTMMILAEYPVLPNQLDEMINRVFA